MPSIGRLVSGAMAVSVAIAGTSALDPTIGSPRLTAAGRYVSGDFDGDGRADLAIYRRWVVGESATARWYVLTSGSNFSYAQAWSIDTGSSLQRSRIIADFDGDGRTEMSAWDAFTENTWRIRYSTDGYSAGSETVYRVTSTTNPVVASAADLGGNGGPALMSYDPFTGAWHAVSRSSGAEVLPATYWGRVGDVPVPGDYDGDQRTDLTVWRPEDGRWYILGSKAGYTYVFGNARAFHWGTNGDIPLRGDFDGDAIDDLTVWRPSTGTWYVLFSSSGYSSAGAGAYNWGSAGDEPVPADYDGDGRTDLAVWRPSDGTWYLLFSGSNYAYAQARAIQWGSGSFRYGDEPIPRASPGALLGLTARCPRPVQPGQFYGIACLVDVTPGAFPVSTRIQVFANMSIFNRLAQQPGIRCTACGSETYELDLRVPDDMTPGIKTVPVWVVDEQGRRADTTASITVVPR